MSPPAVRQPVTLPPVAPLDYENAEPCPRRLPLSIGSGDAAGGLWVEMIQPLPKQVPPLARDGSGPCCYDCASADGLNGLVLPGKYAKIDTTYFLMARVAVGNDRMEALRLPGIPMGLRYDGLIRDSHPDDLHAHYAWLDRLPYFSHRREGPDRVNEWTHSADDALRFDTKAEALAAVRRGRRRQPYVTTGYIHASDRDVCTDQFMRPEDRAFMVAARATLGPLVEGLAEEIERHRYEPVGPSSVLLFCGGGCGQFHTGVVTDCEFVIRWAAWLGVTTGDTT